MAENEREVTDAEQTKWTCVQAYAGLGDGAAAEALAERLATDGRPVPVVCTPTGGAQSVRLELSHDWVDALSDDDLLSRIEAQRR